MCRITAGTRTTTSFGLNSNGEGLFQNLNEKIKDLRTFLEELRFDSKEIDMEDFLNLYNPVDPLENKLHTKKYKDALYIG